MFKFSIFVLLIITYFPLINNINSATPPTQPTTKWKCNAADQEKIDKLMRDAYILGTNQQFPTDNKALKEFCSSRKRMLATGESYKEACVRGQLKNTLSVFIFSCGTSSPPPANSTPNVPRPSISRSVLQLGHRLGDGLLSSGGRSAGDRKGNPRVKRTSGGCSEAQSKDVVGLIRAAFEDSINLLCGDYSEHTDRCDRFSFVTKSSTSGQKAYSFIMSAIQIVADL
ncbi:hypothetical protein TYRP_001461 [Tyrophagus putrescentiae]|nr:hypothetical protein TYRP_001461 [Tyrophagus putrescentiae]